jgi:hypothetical protein
MRPVLQNTNFMEFKKLLGITVLLCPDVCAGNEDLFVYGK